MLTAAQLDAMRATTDAALPSEATISRRTAVPDVGGGTTYEWQDVAAVACRIAPQGGGEGSTFGGGVVDETTHVVTLPAGADVTEADRLVVDGQAFEVTLVRKRGEWELARRVEVREVAS